MIMDSAGNAVDTFDSYAASVAALVSFARSDPEAAHHLVVIAFDQQGEAVGEPLTVADVEPEAAIRTVLTSVGWLLQTPLMWHSSLISTTAGSVWRTSENVHLAA